MKGLVTPMHVCLYSRKKARPLVKTQEIQPARADVSEAGVFQINFLCRRRLDVDSPVNVSRGTYRCIPAVVQTSNVPVDFVPVRVVRVYVKKNARPKSERVFRHRSACLVPVFPPDVLSTTKGPY